MERAQQSEIEPLPPDKDRLSQIRDRVSDHSRERPDGFTSGVAFEKLHPIAPDTALPATLSAVTLLGVLFVLVILVVWLRKHLSCSSSKKGHDSSARSAIGESRPLRAMEPESVRRPNVTVEVPAEDRVEEELDDFKFKLPDVLEDVTDLKYIDELDGTRNVGPSAFEKNEDKPMTTFGSCGNDTIDGTGSQTMYAVESLVGPVSPRELPVSVKNDRGSGESRMGKFKTAPADQQWIVHRKPPLDWRSYSVNVPKPFGFVEDDFVGDVLRGDSRAKKFSATRSPSLEKDEKSPFPTRKTETAIDFVFEKDVIEKCKNNTIRRSGNSSPIVEVRVQPASTDAHRIYDTNTKAYTTARTQTSRSSESFNRIDEKRSPTETNLYMGKFGACNVGLRICTVNDNANPGFQMEKIEMQNSPRSIDPSLGKENSPRFNFSPKLFGSSDSKSPKFFGSSDQKSPKFFSDNRSKNSSPKLFGTDRTPSPSPQRFAYSDCYRVSQSPLILDNGNGDYFDFEKKNDTDCYANNNDLDNSEEIADLSKSKVLCESDSLNCVTKESPIGQSNDSDNLDTNVNVVPCLSDTVTKFRNEEVLDFTNEIDDDSGNDQILSDRCQSIASRIAGGDINCDETDSSISVKNTLCVAEDSQENLIIAPSGANSANYRRQRLKSISLDSDNAKFIEQNLGIPIAKHLKQENLFDSFDGEKSACLSEDGVNYPSQISPPANECVKRTYFNFSDDESEKFRMFEKTVNSSEIYRESVITISQSEDLVSLADDLELSSKFLRENVPTIAFNEMQPRFSPKEFESSSDGADQILKVNKNKRNLTIDLNKRDIGLEKELSDYDCSDSSPEKRMTPKTPTLKVKATSLDSSETLNLSLPQNNTLQVPQNSISVPNTPKRQLKRTLTQKVGKLIKASHYNAGNCGGNLNEIVPRICSENQQGRKLYMNVKCPSNFIDSGIFLRENHANLMLFQATKYPISRNVNNNSTNFTRRMGSFDENMVDYAETNRIAPSQLSENRLSLLQKPHDTTMLGSNLLSFKQNLSVSSTNLKTLPEGVPSNDFEIQPEEKSSKKTLLQRRGSNQSLTINLDNSGSNLKYSTLSLQGSNLSLASFGASNHNLASIKNSASNFSLNTDNRQKKNILERRNSNTSLTLNLDYASQHCSRFYSSSHCNLQGSHYSLVNQEIQTGIQGKKCLLQRRGSNTSLTLNLQSSSSNLNRCTSNSSLNIHNEIKVGQKKGLLERRSSNTSLTLNINNSSTQFDNNRILSISNYNLDGAGSGLSRYNSNQSINNSSENHKKGLLERRNSNTSLTLNINSSNFNLQSSDVPRDIEIDDSVLQNNLKTYTDGDSFHGNRQREKHRKSLSTENLFSKSYKSRMQQCKNLDNVYSFGSHDNLWSNCCNTDSMDNIESSGSRNLTYICGDQENEIIYAFGDRHHIENVSYQAAGPVRNITTKPLSPHSTSEDFKLYLANIQHLQNASNVLSRQQLKDLNSVFQDGYSKTDCPLMSKMQKEMTHIDFVAINLKQLDIEGPKCQEDMNEGEYNPQRLLPEPVLPCPEYQKSLLRNLHHEFWDLPTNFQEKPMVFGSHPKNRYKSILPNEHSRVILRAEPGETDEGYINANYVKGYEYTKNSYIATQGPLQNTIYDFWLMVYQNGCQFHRDGCTKTNEERHFGSPQSRTKSQSDYGSKRFTDSQNISIQKIVMLTNLLENGRQKCEKYFPTELHEEMVFQRMPNSSYSSSCGEGSFFSENELINDGDEDLNTFKVKNVGVINKTGYTVRKLHVEYKNKFLKDKIECSKLSDLTETGNNSENLKISIIEPEDSSETSVDSKTDYLVVYHYWFDNWADHKCPKDVTALLDLSLDVLQCKIMDFEIHDKSKLNSKSGKDKKSHDADAEGASKERRMSAFQSAKAFFDEFSRLNSHDEFIRPGSYRKNSLASKLDLPMPRNDIVRRESTGAIDSSRIKGKSLFCENKEEHAKKRTVLNMKCDNKSNTLVEMPPIIVHCSAGIGRTGCLIAVMNGIKQLKADEKVDILGIVCNMRLNRGGMVQNSEQYELIHKVLCLYDEKNLPDID